MILVTGATGFLGSELCVQLSAKGAPLKAMKRKGSGIPPILREIGTIEWVEATLDDADTVEAALDGVDQVYHCAALVSFDPAKSDALFRVNVTGTASLVNLCIQKGIRLLHVSSIATLGEARKGELITEETYPDPSIKTHAYGMSKNAGELEVWRGIAEGLDAVIVNPSVIIGANALYEGSGAIFKLIKDGMRFYTDGASGFVAVGDVAKSMILLMNSSISGQRFIVSSENYCYKELFTKIAIGFGVKPPTIEARPWMLAIAWRGAKLASLISRKEPSLTKDTAASSFNLSYYDNQKIRSAVNMEFIPLNKVIEEITSRLMVTDQSNPGNG